MARLTNLGPGDITDRLTILALKILHKGAQKHWVDERNALLAKIGGRETNGTWLEAALKLAAVNAALWAEEDRLRGWRDRWRDTGPDSSGLSGGPGTGYIAATALQVVEVAFRIQELNDQRAALVDEINRATGEFLGAEKG